MGSKIWQRIGVTSIVLGCALSSAVAAIAGSRPVIVPTLDSTGTNADVNNRGFSGGSQSLDKFGFATDGVPRFLVPLNEGETLTLNSGWQATRSSAEPGGFRVDIGQENAIALQAAFQSLSSDAKANLGLSDQSPVLSALSPDVRVALTSLRVALEQPTPNGIDIGTSLNNVLAAYTRFAGNSTEPLSPELIAFQNELAKLRRQIKFSR